MIPAFVARDVRVGDSDQSRTLSSVLQVIVKGSFHRRGTFLLSPHLTWERKRSSALSPTSPLEAFAVSREQEEGQEPRVAEYVFLARGKPVSDTDQSSTVWFDVP